MQRILPEPAAVKNDIDASIAAYCQAKIAAADDLSSAYGDLWRSISTLIQSGGKRVRPYMLLLSYAAFANDQADYDDACRAALAAELLHSALLMHDDIIDRDSIRYGVPNITGQYMEAYAAEIADVRDRQHFASSAAIMGGDLLIAAAYNLLNEMAGIDDTRRRATVDCMAEGIFVVCGGELLDTESAFRKQPAPAIKIAEYKTASYSFIAPLCMGAILGGADQTEQNMLREYGRALGIAYQLKDDLLGVFGDSSITGKTTIGDIREGKKTYLIELFYERATSHMQDEFAAIFGVHDLTDEAYASAMQLLEKSGAKAACEEAIETYAQTARDAIEALGIDEVYKNAYNGMIEKCVQRER